MVDLKNKELIKVMWLPEEEEILFHLKSEKALPITSKWYNHVLRYIDLNNWKELYRKAYDNWLNNGDSFIYDINNEVNLIMINALIAANETLKNEMIFYWFDIDRTYHENFLWEYCPISKQRLIFLGDNYPKINSFISPEYPLIFPSTVINRTENKLIENEIEISDSSKIMKK